MENPKIQEWSNKGKNEFLEACDKNNYITVKNLCEYYDFLTIDDIWSNGFSLAIKEGYHGIVLYLIKKNSKFLKKNYETLINILKSVCLSGCSNSEKNNFMISNDYYLNSEDIIQFICEMYDIKKENIINDILQCAWNGAYIHNIEYLIVKFNIPKNIILFNNSKILCAICYAGEYYTFMNICYIFELKDIDFHIHPVLPLDLIDLTDILYSAVCGGTENHFKIVEFIYERFKVTDEIFSAENNKIFNKVCSKRFLKFVKFFCNKHPESCKLTESNLGFDHYSITNSYKKYRVYDSDSENDNENDDFVLI
jgi:hypothetical protein